MDWISELSQNQNFPLLASFALGLLTAVSPCPLATNITATAYIARTILDRRKVLLSGFLYTFGRMFSYTILAYLVYFGVSKFKVSKMFQGYGEKILGPLLIIVGLIVLDVIKLNFLSKFSIADKLSEKFKDRGLLGSFFLGVIFAMAFCPYSGAMFFAVLLPMMFTVNIGPVLPITFSIGTGLPVIFFSFVISFSIEKLSSYFNKVTKVESVMRTLAGITFIASGIYYIYVIYF
jgi:cytochrome c-type biogenesis protein